MSVAREIHAATKTYTVQVHDDFSFLESLLVAENAFYVVDKNVWAHYSEQLARIPSESLFLLDATEANKTIETALAICEAMVQMDAKRNAHLISFGGGITQDVTGFAANILYRGIRWSYVPTTLLAACDSCIGGKTSLNYKSYKNLLGTFFPPDDIHICPVFFTTLSVADVESGLGEVVKFNVMAGAQSLTDIEANIDALLALDPATTNRFVLSSLAFKAAIIERDEFDRGDRVLLNFAHTFGHAFEVSSAYAIPHGTAVALGMLTANSLSVARGILSEDLAKRIEVLVDKILPEIDPALIQTDSVLSAIRKDKKQVGASITAILLGSAFELHVVHDVSEAEIETCCAWTRAFLEQR